MHYNLRKLGYALTILAGTHTASQYITKAQWWRPPPTGWDGRTNPYNSPTPDDADGPMYDGPGIVTPRERRMDQDMQRFRFYQQYPRGLPPMFRPGEGYGIEPDEGDDE